jgi:antitoxin PrlF
LHHCKDRDIISLLNEYVLTTRDNVREIVSTVTSKGQVTIPAEVRKLLGIRTNDKISFVIEDEGTVRLKAPQYPDIASVVGAAGKLKEPLTWQEMKEIAQEDRIEEEATSSGA